MFDFEKLNVYQEAIKLNKNILCFIIENKKIDIYLKDQLKRASISIVLNISEGAGRYSKPDKRRFYVIARGCVYEVVGILNILSQLGLMNNNYQDLYQCCENISKMLIGMINNLK
ncbi:MAG: four helix bundle protein [Candidatus Absconditabacteria bacterium]